MAKKRDLGPVAIFTPPTHAESVRMAAEDAARRAVESHPKHQKKLKRVTNAIVSAVNQAMKGE